MRNTLAREAIAKGATWLLPLDDDDLLDPDCVQTLLQHSDDADIVYPWCRVHGRDDFHIVNKLFHEPTLHVQNYIPVTALISTDAFQLLGGYKQTALEDWDLWRRAAYHGLKFKCVPEVLWTYRFHESNSFQAAA